MREKLHPLRQDDATSPEGGRSILPFGAQWRSMAASLLLHTVLILLVLFWRTDSPAVYSSEGEGGAKTPFEVGLAPYPGWSTTQNAAPHLPVMEPVANALATPNKEPTPPQPAVVKPRPVEQNKTVRQRVLSPPAQRQTPRAEKVGNAPPAPFSPGTGNGASLGVAGESTKPFGFSLGNIDTKPQIIKNVPVIYPPDARRKHIAGHVLVRFHLSERGVVSFLHIKEAYPPGVFDENTLKAVRLWKFSPARHDGENVPVWVELPIEFGLQ